MGYKIKPKNFQKRQANSKTFKDWGDEQNQFRGSINPSFGVLTEKDKLYDRKHKKSTILDDEFIECADAKEVIEAILGRRGV